MDTLTENEVILEHISSLSILCVEDNKTTQMMYEAIIVKNIVFQKSYCL